MTTKETELTTISSKGQVVIPQSLRNRLKLAPKTKLLVYGQKNLIVLQKLKIPKSNLDQIFKTVDMRSRKYKKLTEADVQKEIEAYRREKRKHQ